MISASNYAEMSPIPLSDYAKKLDLKVKRRYEEKISAIGIDPVLIEGKYFQPDCLPPVESTDLLFYLVLETSYYTKQQFKAFRSLQAYNQMVSGFIMGVQGHIIEDKFVVVAKVRHSQRMNDSLIPIWIITEKQGTVLSAHCCGCKAGLGECCSHVASVLFYLEAWTKINGKLSCTQVKCSWILPSYVNEVEYSRVRNINFTSAKKMKADLDATLDGLPTVIKPGKPQIQAKVITKTIPVPTDAEMGSFYADLSKCKSKPVALSLVSPYADSFVLKSQTIPTIHDLSTPQYQELTYLELLQICHEKEIILSDDQISQIEKDTRAQSQGTDFFKHRAGRIGASQSKQASHTNPALPSRSLIQSICYPEYNKLFTEAIIHGCKHEASAISAYEQTMKEIHKNFKLEKCGMFVNKDYPWLHATPDFLCSCDCCGKGCGEVKCPFCIENCDFEQYILKKNACLKKDEAGNVSLKTDHAYYYQTQQQLFTVNKSYCDFVVCAFDDSGGARFFNQRIVPDVAHWQTVLPKLTIFWRTCVLPEVLAKWYTRKHFQSDGTTNNKPLNGDGSCYCRKRADETSVLCCNPECAIKSFHLSCLRIDSIPKTWYCPYCRTLPEFKRSKKKQQPPKIISTSAVLDLDVICTCKSKPSAGDKLLECHNVSCNNGNFFHLTCLKYKRMPNNSRTTWICPGCRRSRSIVKSLNDVDGITFVKVVHNPLEKYKPIGDVTQEHFDTIMSPTGWLDCTIVHDAQTLLMNINESVKGFQRTTLGPCRQFDIILGDFVQILHVNNNHWVCISSINCHPGYVNLLDSLTNDVVSQEVKDLARNILGPSYQGVHILPVQQQLNLSDCGVFAIAFATCLVYAQNPQHVHFDIPMMRPHLLRCLKNRRMEVFPSN